MTKPPRIDAASRRRQCERDMLPGVRQLVSHACLMGFSREEVLIAIGDAADAELADLTEDRPDGWRIRSSTTVVAIAGRNKSRRLDS